MTYGFSFPFYPPVRVRMPTSQESSNTTPKNIHNAINKFGA